MHCCRVAYNIFNALEAPKEFFSPWIMNCFKKNVRHGEIGENGISNISADAQAKIS